MQRKRTIEEIKSSYLSRGGGRKAVGKICSILPPVKLEKISKEILGLKTYQSITHKLFGFAWRLVTAVFLIAFMGAGWSPFMTVQKTILALTGDSGTVDLYTNICSTDYHNGETSLGWWNEGKVLGAPSVASLGSELLFSADNSSFYNGGHFDLICGDFNQNEQEQAVSKKNIEEKNNISELAATSSAVIDLDPELIPALVSESQDGEATTTGEGESASELLEEAINIEQPIASSTADNIVIEPVTVAEESATASPAVIIDETPSEISISSEAEPAVEIVELAQPEITTEIMDAGENLISRLFYPLRKSISKYFHSLQTFARGNSDLEDLGSFDGARVKVSLALQKKIGSNAVEEDERPLLVILYSLDEAGAIATSTGLWRELTTITAAAMSNETNGGYLSYDVSEVKNWDDLKKLRVKFEGKLEGENGYLTYVDSVSVEASYSDSQETEKEITKADRARWAKMLDKVSEKNDFKVDEKPDFRFRYKKKFQTIANLLSIGSYWTDVNLRASLIDARGQEADYPLTILFEDDGFFRVRAVDLPREFKPGKYSVRFNINDSSGLGAEIIDLSHDFSWGVLALNVNKSIYLPSETAYLQMGVLNDLGHTLCDAKLSLVITAPDGGIATLTTDNGLISKNAECGPDNVISAPDYAAYYGAAGAGAYQISLTAETANGIKTITDQFEIRDYVPFDIERTGPTRIYPKADYEMKIRIKANEDYSGDIQEIVPESFKIMNTELRIMNNAEIKSVIHDSSLSIQNGEQQIKFTSIVLKAGDEIDISYTFDAPDISPEFFLLGPASIGTFAEIRKWQIASDAVAYRARTVQFIGGAYSANGATGQNTDTNQSFAQFNFQLAENSVTIKNAYVILEARISSYVAADTAITGSNVTFDSCAGASCGADAWTGTSSVATNDATTLAYDETESNQVRILLDVTNEAQLAAYSGNGSVMQGQVGYRFDKGSAGNSISSAKATLVVTYTYDKNSSPSITNTVIYPLEAQGAGNSGTKSTSTATNCVFGTSCPKFDYNMDIPEYSTASGSAQLAQWFQVNEQNDLNTTNDVTVNLKIGANATSSNFILEAALSGQANPPQMFFPAVAGFTENTAQTIEYRGAGTNAVHYLLGGEVVETYSASSSAPTKTRTVSFPIGVVTNGNTTATATAFTNVYFPENDLATGTVRIKKAWVRVIGNNRLTNPASITVEMKVGDNASSSPVIYNHDPSAAAAIVKSTFNIFHVIPATDYVELEGANAAISKMVTVGTKNSIAGTMGGVTAELMITYTYTDESKGYLTNLNLFAGQMASAPAVSATSTAANLVVPENVGKTMLSAGMSATYLQSTSSAAMPAANNNNFFDVNIATVNPVCNASTGFMVPIVPANFFSDFLKSVATSSLGVVDNTALVSCYANTYNNTGSTVAKMNAVLNYTYAWVNAPPTGTLAAPVNRKDGSGIVDLAINVDDADKDDLRAKLEYEAGTTCTFASATNLSLDETDASATSTYGDAKIDNNLSFQIGSSTGWIITTSGANTVNFDWPSKNNLPNTDDTFCVRLTTNDNVFDQTAVSTSTISIDNLAPTAPGALTATNTRATSSYLLFSATSTENHFLEYKIFYKVYDGAAVTEMDSVISSGTVPALGDIDFLGATSTQVALAAGTTYSFNIFVYDTYGNKASSTQIDFATNNYPTASFNSVAQKINGSGRVDISFTADDPDNDDTLRAKLEYEAGSDCGFASPLDPTLDENPANASTTFGVMHIDDNSAYQVGTTSYWIVTSPGANTVNFDWLSKADIPNATSTYCLRLTINDGKDDQFASATTTVIVDNAAPSSPGALTNGGVALNSITLNFGATSTEPNFDLYKIFYKAGVAGVTESDTPHADANLDDINFNGATTTPVSGLAADTYYVFNIWAYDQNGNKASSTEVVIKTNASITNDSLTFTNPQSGNIAVANGTSEWNFRAVISETSGWNVLASTTLRLADSADEAALFDDLVFKWNETTNVFSETGADVLGAASVSPNSTSTCSANTCTLDFKIIFNYNFATSSINYSAELLTSNDSDVTDEDVYNNIYQVKTIKVVQTHYRWRNNNGGD